jgi:hypothetical protein
MIPCAAIPLGIAAIILGVKGLTFAKEHPQARGKVHALVGIIGGGLFLLLNVAAIIWLLLSSHSR